MLRRRKAVASAPMEPVALSAAAVLDGHRPTHRDGPEWAAWRAAWTRINEASLGTEFDLRRGLRLEGAALHEWRSNRRAWAAQVLQREGLEEAHV